MDLEESFINVLSSLRNVVLQFRSKIIEVKLHIRVDLHEHSDIPKFAYFKLLEDFEEVENLKGLLYLECLKVIDNKVYVYLVSSEVEDEVLGDGPEGDEDRNDELLVVDSSPLVLSKFNLVVNNVDAESIHQVDTFVEVDKTEPSKSLVEHFGVLKYLGQE